MRLAVVDGREYRVHFQHEHLGNGSRARDFTYCTVVTQDQHGRETRLIGEAKRNPIDQHNKRVGRKTAFAYAVAVLPRNIRALLWSSARGRGIV